MNNNYFQREISLIGEDAFLMLNNSKVIIFGLGGVGGYVLEALVRAGVGTLALVDSDTVNETNINRQLLATTNTIGQKKVDIAKERALSINPNVKIITYDMFYLPENSDKIPLSGYDYIVDAIDTLSAKLELAKNAEKLGIGFISCMGTANKLDPCGFKVCDIYKTEGCPLARTMRNGARKLGLKGFKVVYSGAPSKNTIVSSENGRHTPASISYVPPVAGFIAAGEVICDLAEINKTQKGR